MLRTTIAVPNICNLHYRWLQLCNLRFYDAIVPELQSQSTCESPYVDSVQSVIMLPSACPGQGIIKLSNHELQQQLVIH